MLWRSFLGGCNLQELRSLDKTLAVAEPAPGAYFHHTTEIAGISKVFQGGAVCYHNDAKASP